MVKDARAENGVEPYFQFVNIVKVKLFETNIADPECGAPLAGKAEAGVADIYSSYRRVG
jgi:hypothetical protein